MRKALLIGINYENSESELYGCINDIIEMKKILVEKYHYSDIIMLSDQTEVKPTKSNIISAIEKIVHESNNCSEIFIHYSGHGTYVYDKNGDETDNKDEALVPLDYETSGLITDDQLNNIISKTQCATKVILDCCHSGSGLDLYCNAKVKNNLIDKYYEKRNTYQEVGPTIMMISGCMDDQTSADAYNRNKGKYMGALSSSFLKVLEENGYDISINIILLKLYQKLDSSNFDQKPIFSSNKEINISSQFLNTKHEPSPTSSPAPSPTSSPTPNNTTFVDNGDLSIQSVPETNPTNNSKVDEDNCCIIS